MAMYFISYVLIFSMFECATLYLSHVHVCSAKISLLWSNKQYRKITKFVVLRSMRSHPMFCLNWFLLEKFVLSYILNCWFVKILYKYIPVLATIKVVQYIGFYSAFKNHRFKPITTESTKYIMLVCCVNISKYNCTLDYTGTFCEEHYFHAQMYTNIKLHSQEF